MDQVDETLRIWRSTPFVWGKSDCLLSLADHVIRCCGMDPAAPYRGTYSDEAGALAHVEESGGLAALIARTGWEETDDPQRGDLAILDTGHGEVGVLCTGDGVAARLERGVVEVSVDFVTLTRAWKAP